MEILKELYGGKEYATPPCEFILHALLKETRADCATQATSVDVQDSALLHIGALILPDVKQQRIFAACTPWNISSITQLLRGLFPQRTFPDIGPDLGVDLTVFKETNKAEELLTKDGKEGMD